MPEWVLIVVTVISVQDGTRHLEMKWFDSFAECNKAKIERFDPSGRTVFMQCQRSEDLPI